jgi:riboflavin synthase
VFTGIVEHLGVVREAAPSETGKRLVIDAGLLASVPIGASMSVNGVCLTVVETSESRISVDVVPETLDRSNLGELVDGSPVNLERAMGADGRFDGHIVQGHVDGVGKVSEVSDDSGGTVMTIQAPDELMRFVVEKGSITVDGVSLTVAGIGEGSFTVALIPHTLEVTNLGLRAVGQSVNLEIDVLAKYVERLLERST